MKLIKRMINHYKKQTTEYYLLVSLWSVIFFTTFWVFYFLNL